MRRRRGSLRKAEPTEMELEKQSTELAKRGARYMDELWEVANELEGQIKDVRDRQKRTGDGMLLFLLDDFGSLDEFRAEVDQINGLMNELATIKQQHDELIDTYNRLSGGWTDEEWAHRTQHGYQD